MSAQAMQIVRTKDSGTLQYDTYYNDDQSECIVIERYRDSEAAMEHAANLADLSAESSRRSPWFTASSWVSRVKSSERSWPAASFLNSSRPASRRSPPPCEGGFRCRRPPRFRSASGVHPCFRRSSGGRGRF